MISDALFRPPARTLQPGLPATILDPPVNNPSIPLK